MSLNEVKFVVNRTGELNKDEEELLINTYNNLFIKIFGYDMYESYLKIINSNIKKPSNSKLQKFAQNYTKSLNILESVKNNDNFTLLMIYLENKLIGFGRMKVINNKEVSVPDIAIVDDLEDIEKDIWQKALKFVENYFTRLGFHKMYVEVPINDVGKLTKTINLGFKEDPDDIEVSEEANKYVLNKILERKINE